MPSREWLRGLSLSISGSARLAVTFSLETGPGEMGAWTVDWRIIPRSAERSPHAPWWNQADREDVFYCFSLIPTADILGYLYDCQRHVHRDVISLVSDRVISHLSGLETIEMHELLCCLRLQRTETLPEDTRDRIRRKLIQLIDGTVACDPTKWKEYSLRPLQVVDDPGSPFMAGIEEAVAENLDYEISSQNEDGSWTPTWSWGNTFPDAWDKARRELSLKDTARVVGEKKLRMASHREAEGLAGLQVGGISALALLNRPFDVFIDRPALDRSHVCVSAG